MLLDRVATVAPATSVIFHDKGEFFALTLIDPQEFCSLLGRTKVRHLHPAPFDLAADASG